MMYKVLFICKHNAGRSVLAESIATNILPADFSLTSGGSHPTGKVHPVVQKYLDDHQLPIPHIHTHSWEERTQFLPDIVIILCDSLHQETAPQWLAGGVRVNWQVDAFPTDGSDEDMYAHCEKVAQSLERRITKVSDMIIDGLGKDQIRDYLNELREM
ncbi:low molecular weight phosphatase family protein [Vibrio alginolyticus]|uniref:arsenate-mycothiol transferase ArsC n=1 Tax=Vibrio alginolyticus TaxID=663 RepID=UPI00215DDFD3|nr:low molecular weight phosphatase family protein [Vibrio alginolyticus]MCS0238278.1 low molecular weight phosphatase family protein [Vibrio alginolyticus]